MSGGKGARRHVHARGQVLVVRGGPPARVHAHRLQRRDVPGPTEGVGRGLSRQSARL